MKLNTIKETDFESAKDYSIFMLQSHITIESLFYHLLTRGDIIRTMNVIFPECNIEKLRKHIKISVEDEESYIVTDPNPSFNLEYIIRSAVSISILNDNKELLFTDLLLALFLDEEGLDILDILTLNKVLPDLNTIEILKRWNKEMHTEPQVSPKNDLYINEFKVHTELMNDYVKNNSSFSESIGCEEKLEDLERALLRTYKSSVIITGKAGVGKSNLIETFVDKINKGNVHEDLMGAEIYLLNVNSLLSDIKYHGVLEARMNAVIKVLEENPKMILFIDEIHMLYGAGGANSNNDLMNMIKGPLSKNSIKIIGATTTYEYDKFISKNSGFQRRFTNITVDEPTEDQTIDILMKRKSDFEQHYKISISDDAVKKIVELSNTYIRSRFNPDKSVDILDSVMARKKLYGQNLISTSDIYTEIGKYCRIPTDEISQTKLDKLEHMGEELKSKIIGQNNAFDILTDVLSVSMSGLRGKDKTMGNFLFQGPTSCGKTETAKIIAKELGIPLIRYDMSAFSEKHTVATLIGSPPGYIGYNDGIGGGKLINDIDQNPHCVLLLDEIEKSHPDVLKILLQIMDYGKLTSSGGKEAYFSKVIVIMTSNIGSKDSEKSVIGFGNNDNFGKIDEFIKDFLPPEFRARLDTIIKFKKLDIDDITKIVKLRMDEFSTELKGYNLSVDISEDVISRIANDSFNSNLGARNIQNIITNVIKPKFAKVILSNTSHANIKKTVSLKDNVIDIV